MDEHALESIELEILHLLRNFISSATYKKVGSLDRSAYLLLHQLIYHGPAGVKALAAESHLDISTISRQVAALEQKGYLLKMPDPLDKRACSLQITDLGIKEFNEFKGLRSTHMAKIFESWTDAEGQQFEQLLKKYNHSFTHL